MNATLQSQLDRVESSLNTLIDSITTYNPSVPAAIDLLSADDELTKGLEQRIQPAFVPPSAPPPTLSSPPTNSPTHPLPVATHQANHARLLTLHATATSLDAQLKTTLTLLAATRADLLATPATPLAPDARAVPYDELLAYAKRISKFTVPPTLRPPLPEKSQPPPPSQQLSGGGEQQGKKEAEANGVNGGAVGGEGAIGLVAEEEGGAAKGIGVSSLATGEAQWLDPGAQMPFVPWPTEEVIRRGALARIQGMLERGVDPSEADGAVEEEKDTKMGVGAEVKLEGAVVEPVRKESASVGLGRVEMKRDEKPAVFGGLDLYDPDDE